MKAEDTVMNKDKLEEVSSDAAYRKNLPYLTSGQSYIKRIAQAQAEISFKAGKDESVNELLAYAQSGELDKRFQEIKQVGIKEVVKWINSTCFDVLPEGTSPSLTELSVSKKDWQAKLKEWGVEKE